MDEDGFRRFLKRAGKKEHVVEGLIAQVRARLHYQAGLETPEAFTTWEPQALHQMLVEFVERSGFEGIAPLPKEVRNVIAAAKQLPRVVEY